MKLQGKAILAFNVLLAVACVIVGVLGYFTADHGFGFALEQKAVHDLEEINARYLTELEPDDADDAQEKALSPDDEEEIKALLAEIRQLFHDRLADTHA